jgi:hypothetical protein
MRIMRRHTGVRHIAKHLVMIADLKLLRIALESIAVYHLSNSVIPTLQFFYVE